MALDVGMSYSGLHTFLKGAEPYARTRELLRTWYARTRHQGAPPPTPEEVDAAVLVLTQHLRRAGPQHVSEQEFERLVRRLRSLESGEAD